VSIKGLQLINYINTNFHEEMVGDILKGMTASQKFIPSKYFYDEKGSRLFEEICHLPEYYLTRTEMSILKRSAEEIIDSCPCDLVELGPGTNWKIRTLLERLNTEERSMLRYIPVDFSESAVVDACLELRDIYPEVDILAIVADFLHHLDLIPSDRKRLMLFFGGTIGNLQEEEAIAFLKTVSGNLKRGDRFFFGVDMIKDIHVLHSAYNDSRGITAEFNKNILNVVNRELGAEFDLSMFEHLAFFNERENQVEMHLVAKEEMEMRIPCLDLTVKLKKGETIRTEICRKFNRQQIEEMLSKANLSVIKWLSDPDEWFSIVGVTVPE